MSIRPLGPGDETILGLLATDEPDFDLEGRGERLEPLDLAGSRRYLENPAVLHWVALEGDQVIGDLQCILLPLPAGDGRELLLYDIGVRSAWRRHGTGRALLSHMEGWMRANHVRDVWVLADNPDAAEFYRACGFSVEEPQPVYMLRRVDLTNGEGGASGC